MCPQIDWDTVDKQGDLYIIAMHFMLYNALRVTYKGDTLAVHL